jgi:glycosyltransferase involved in cell wall biosynthesis
MIVTNVGGLAELVPNNKVGYVVDVDKKEIADAILKFYTDKNEQEFIANIKIEKEKFTWKYLCEQLLSLTK